MDLDVLLRAVLERLRRADARGGGGLPQFARIGRERPGAVVAVGARQGGGDIHVGEDVLDRLERTDRPAEGDAVERVVAAHLQRAVGAADLLERGEHRGAVEHLAQQAPAFTGRAERLGLAVLERQLGLVARRVDAGERPGLDAAGLQVNQVEPDIGLAAARAVARHDDGEIGNRAVGDRGLDAIEHAVGGGELDALRRRIARPLEQRQRADRFAGRDLRQPLLLLRVAAGEQQRLGGEIHRGRERHRRHRPAHFLGDHAQFEMTRAGTAEFFRNRDPEKAHLRKALPEVLVVGRLALQHGAHRFRRALLGKETPRLVAKLLLVVGEFEVHVGLLSLGIESRNASPLREQEPVALTSLKTGRSGLPFTRLRNTWSGHRCLSLASRNAVIDSDRPACAFP